MWLLILLPGICSAYWLTGGEILRNNFIVNITEKDGNIKTLTSVKAASNRNNEDTVNLSSLEIDDIENGAFGELPGVKFLNLDYNRLKVLNFSLFSNYPNLEIVSVRYNYITKFYGSLVGSPELSEIWLSDNNITDLTASNFTGLPKSAKIKGIGEKYGIQSLKGLNGWEKTLEIIHGCHPYQEKLMTGKQGWERVFERLSPHSESFTQSIPVKLCKDDDDTVESIQLVVNKESFGSCLSIDASVNESTLLVQSQLGKLRHGWYQIPDKFKGLVLSINRNIGITRELLNDLPASIIMVVLNLTNVKTIKTNIIDNRFLKILQIVGNSVETIEAGAFEKTNLLSIDFSSNHLISIDFVKTLPTSLRQLILNDNQISEIPEDSFVNLKALQYLEIQGNQLTHLPVDSFRGLNELECVSIKSNRVQKLEAGTFDDNYLLNRFDAAHNSIVEIEDGIFKNTKRLGVLILSNNNIKKISQNTFVGLRNKFIPVIVFAANPIDTIEEGSFANMTIDSLWLDFNERATVKGAFKSCRLGKVNDVMDLHSIFAECTSLIEHRDFYGLKISYMFDNIYYAYPNENDSLLVHGIPFSFSM